MSSSDLLPITKELYQQMMTVAWMMIAPMFLLSVVREYAKSAGQPPVFDLIHRAVVTIFLLVFFPEISSAIAEVFNGLAGRFGEKHAMDQLFAQLQQNADPGGQVSRFPFMLRDWGMSLINYICYAIPFLAWYIMKTIYHFLWSLLSAVAPLAILCNLFPGLSHVTKNLFASLLEIASWNVLWQIMAVMLFGLKYVQPSGNYFDALSFNLFIGIGLIAVPFIVHSFVRNIRKVNDADEVFLDFRVENRSPRAIEIAPDQFRFVNSKHVEPIRDLYIEKSTLGSGGD